MQKKENRNMINTEITTTKGMEQAQKKVEQAKRLYA